MSLAIVPTVVLARLHQIDLLHGAAANVRRDQMHVALVVTSPGEMARIAHPGGIDFVENTRVTRKRIRCGDAIAVGAVLQRIDAQYFSQRIAARLSGAATSAIACGTYSRP